MNPSLVVWRRDTVEVELAGLYPAKRSYGYGAEWLLGCAGPIKEEIQMKLSLLALGFALVQFAIMGEPSPESQSQTVGKSESTAPSDKEKNIRAYIELMRSDIRSEKAQVMGTVMQLDAQDSVKFWPIYKDFEGELTRHYDEMTVLVKNYVVKYESITDVVADELATKLLDLEKRRNDLKRKYYQRFKVALDPIVAIRFLQVENQIERLVDLQIASELPVVVRRQP